MEYKVITSFIERNDLENRLNTLAKEGWIVKEIFLQTTQPSMATGAKHEFFTVLMERPHGH